MNGALESIIEDIKAMRAEFDDLEARLVLNDMKRLAIQDDYAAVEALDWMEFGAFK